MSLLELATYYRDNGLSITGSNQKGSSVNWKKFQTEKPTDADLVNIFTTRKATMIAIVCGSGSGNLEVIDIDTKHDQSGTLWTRLWDKIMDYYKQAPPFEVVTTPSGGIHLYYRCEVIEGNQELAVVMKNGAKAAIIETRGQGGLVMAPPSAGYTSQTNKVPLNIPTITPSERDDMLSICREFNEVTEVEREVKTRTSHTYKHTPWDQYNQTDNWKEVITDAGWILTHKNEAWDYYRRPGKDWGHSASWNTVERLWYVFTSSSGFTPRIGYRPFDILKIVKHAGDVRKAILDIKAAGLGVQFTPKEDDFMGTLVEGWNKGYSWEEMMDFNFDAFEETFHKEIKDDGLKFEHLALPAKARADAMNNIFWFENDQGKLILDEALLGDFLENRGYRLLVEQNDSTVFRLVIVDRPRHMIEYISLDMLRKNLEAWAIKEGAGDNNVPVNKLRNLIRKMTDAIISRSIDFLPRLIYSKIKFLKKGGSEDSEWFTFTNGAMRVTKQNYKMFKYEELEPDVLVWKSNIRDFNFEISTIETEAEFNESVIWLFLKRLAGITPQYQHLDHERELPKEYPDLHQKFMAIISTVGYLLSTHKDPNEPYAPIFEEDIASSSLGGGTGKSLLFEIIACLRNVVTIDCKIWNPKDRFPYQLVTLDTDIILFDDYEPKGFKFSILNNVISGKLTIENKNEKAFLVPKKDTPKVAINSNFKVSDSTDFESRRQKKIYVARYFHKNYKPKQELGEIFGPQWTEIDYQLCYNVLFYCLQVYLQDGIIDFPLTKNAMIRHLTSDFHSDFMEFMEELLADNTGAYILVTDAWARFKNREDFDKRYWKQSRLVDAMKSYGEKMGLQFWCETNNTKKAGDYHKKYFIFTEKNEILPEFSNNTIKKLSGSSTDPF